MSVLPSKPTNPIDPLDHLLGDDKVESMSTEQLRERIEELRVLATSPQALRKAMTSASPSQSAMELLVDEL